MINKSNVVVHTCKPRLGKHGEFPASLSYRERHCLKNTNEKKEKTGKDFQVNVDPRINEIAPSLHSRHSPSE